MSQDRFANGIDRRALVIFPLAIGAVLLSRTSKVNFKNVVSVEVVAAQALIAAGALVIDVRDQEKYSFRHIAGSILLPLEVLRIAVPATFTYAKSSSVLIYCNDGVNHGPEATAILNNAGFLKAVNLKHGIEGWAAAGMPLSHGHA